MTALARSLGLATTTFYGVGLILGAGIYSVLGVAAGHAGDALWMSFLAGGACALFTGLAYAELATAYPRAGAEYVYLAKALPEARAVSAIVGLVLILAAAATAATVAVSFAGYLRALTAVPAVITAVVLLALCTAVNVIGLRESTWINVAFTLAELAGLVLFVAIATPDPEFGAALTAAPSAGVFTAAALVFFAYLGFEEIANLVEEMKRPARDLPRAMMIAIAVTTAMYVAVALAAVALEAPAALGDSESPLAAAAAKTKPWAGRVLAGVALFATANTALITLVAASRMVYGMAKGGDLPAALARVSRRKTPWAAGLALGVVAAALVPLGGLEWIAGLSSFGALVAFAAINAALVVLRFRAPDHERPFRVPLSIGRVPILGVLGLVTTLALLTQFSPAVYLAGAIGVAASVVVHLIARRRR